MIYICIALIVVIAGQSWVILSLVKRGDRERHAVEMKLLAVCNPPAAVHVESMHGMPQGKVYTMDDEAMVKWEQDHETS